MKTAILYGPGGVRIEEVEALQVGEGNVLLRVPYCGVCGSDVNYYRGLVKLEIRTIKGHEIAGEVVATG